MSYLNEIENALKYKNRKWLISMMKGIRGVLLQEK
jgi:hypothetical protein